MDVFSHTLTSYHLLGIGFAGIAIKFGQKDGKFAVPVQVIFK